MTLYYALAIGSLAHRPYSLDAKFVPWSVDFRKHLLSVFPLPEGVLPIPQDEFLKPKWRLELKQESSADANSFVIGGHNESPSRNSTPCPVVNPTPSYSITDSSFQRLSVNLIENQRTTPDDHWQDVRHLAFNCNHQVDYEPGDVMTIYPENHPDDVEQILNRMRWTDVADKPLEFSPNDNEETDMLQVPPPISFINPNTTLRTLLTNHLDLTAIPRRSFFSLLAHFTDDQFHKDRLLEFTKPEYLDELFDYTTRPRRSILEVLQEFESVSIPWQWAATVIPELRGRQFSIASGGRLKRSASGDTRIELLVAIVRYKTVIKKIRQGVCTRYLASLKPPTRLQVTLQKGGLAISKKEATRPVIMVGPGTGIAPMRSLLWERHHWSQAGLIDGAHTNGSSYRGDNLLFFGCRNERADYFYRAEWEIIKQQMPLQVHAAFSRDQQQKSYVQGLIREQSDSVYRLLEQNCLVYVCGSSGKMPQAVRAALVDVFVLNGLARAAAEQYLERMEKEGRYKQETW